MVLLKGPVRLGRDLETIVEALYPLQLKVYRPIHALPVSSEAFAEGRYAIHRSARREGCICELPAKDVEPFPARPRRPPQADDGGTAPWRARPPERR
jgi:hypothetical protein